MSMSVIMYKEQDSSAVLSANEKYRYFLSRKLNDSPGKVLFIGVNPSTADHKEDDATVRKWRGFIERKFPSCGTFGVCNLFSYRSTDVKGLNKVEDPIGEYTDNYLKQAAYKADYIVPCWGNSDKIPTKFRYRVEDINKILLGFNVVLCLGKTKNGSPKHPLMLPYTTEIEDYFHNE